MSNFNTDDDYNYPGTPYSPTNDYGHPEFGNDKGNEFGKIKKNPFEKLLNGLGSFSSGFTMEKIIWIIYAIVLVFIVLNIESVLDFLFYATMSVFKYVILIGVIILFGYIIIKRVL